MKIAFVMPTYKIVNACCWSVRVNADEAESARARVRVERMAVVRGLNTSVGALDHAEQRRLDPLSGAWSALRPQREPGFGAVIRGVVVAGRLGCEVSRTRVVSRKQVQSEPLAVNQDRLLQRLVEGHLHDGPRGGDRKSTRLNSSHSRASRMPSSA